MLCVRPLIATPLSTSVLNIGIHGRGPCGRSTGRCPLDPLLAAWNRYLLRPDSNNIGKHTKAEVRQDGATLLPYEKPLMSS